MSLYVSNASFGGYDLLLFKLVSIAVGFGVTGIRIAN